MKVVQPVSRRYDASGRREQARRTRQRVLEEARELFVQQGFASTTVAQIATAAGVSTPTVFAYFTSKANLLKETIETAVVGDGEAVPLAERPALRHVHEGRTAEEVLRRFMAVTAEIADRALPIHAAALAAAANDPQIAGIIDVLEQQRLTSAATIAATAAERAGITEADWIARLRDTIWVLNSPLQYQLLVQQRGWSLDRCREWIADTVVAVAARPGNRATPTTTGAP
jgi:AcrR family transcriptional regulator